MPAFRRTSHPVKDSYDRRLVTYSAPFYDSIMFVELLKVNGATRFAGPVFGYLACCFYLYVQHFNRRVKIKPPKTHNQS